MSSFIIATEPSDYLMNSMNTTLSSDGMACLTVTIVPDIVSEGDETFVVSLAIVLPDASTFVITMTTVTIVDDEGV